MRVHDLPPLWDDRPVTWGEWRPEPVMFVCRRGLRKPEPKPARCDDARGTARETNTGLVDGIARLYLIRCCHDCRQDSVFDRETDEAWQLDDSDYGDAGSVDPTKVQGALF